MVWIAGLQGLCYPNFGLRVWAMIALEIYIDLDADAGVDTGWPL